MAGVSNQPNLKPLIDKQTQAQGVEFELINGSIFELQAALSDASLNVESVRVNTSSIYSKVNNVRDVVDVGFAELKTLLSSEIDSNGDLTVANLTSFKTAIVDEVQNSQSALNFTVSTSGDAILSKVESAKNALVYYLQLNATESSEQTDALDSSVNGYVTAAKTAVIDSVNVAKADTLSGVSGYVTTAKTAVIDSVDAAKTSILSGVSGYVTTAKTAVIDSVNAAKTAVLNGVSGYVTAAKTAVLDEINSARVNILTTISGYITTAKNAVISAVQASENRITANVNAKASGIKSVQRGVVTMDMALMTNVSISSVNLAKSTLIINERGSVGGFLSAANQIRFEKSPTASNYQDGDTAIIYWQVIEYV